MPFLHEMPVVELIAAYGYLAIFVVITLESAGVPMPGETVPVSSAVYAGSTGNLDSGLIIASAAAAIIGDNLGLPGRAALGDAAAAAPRTPDRARPGPAEARAVPLPRARREDRVLKIVFFGRFTAMLRAYAALLAGVNRLDARRFMLFNGLGGLAWATIMGLGSYYCGRSIEKIAGPIGLALLTVVIFGGLALWLFVRRHEARMLTEAEHAIPGPLG